jgi:hypothetical protein
MATVAELEARLESLKAQRDSAVARVSYDGRSDLPRPGLDRLVVTRFGRRARRGKATVAYVPGFCHAPDTPSQIWMRSRASQR